uniref:Uncharacterized protein n=1 Tax=Rhizophora mucronata TaxID=61149 RepID=A0A2P2PB43_RHIMU
MVSIHTPRVLTIFAAKAFDGFNKMFVKLRRPPKAWKLRFSVLSCSTSLCTIHVFFWLISDQRTDDEKTPREDNNDGNVPV